MSFDICMDPRKHRRNQDLEHFHYLTCLFAGNLHCFWTQAPTTLFSVSIDKYTVACSRVSYKWNHPVCTVRVWLFLLSVIHLRFVRVAESILVVW